MILMSEESLYKLNISGREGVGKGKTKVIQLQKIDPLVGKIIGEEINGGLIGLPGYTLKITGGSDFAGIPMRPHVHGPVKKKLLLSKGPGYNPKRKGEKKRKVIRGTEITEDMKQINMVVTKMGKTKLFEEEAGEVGE
jgi:small subunit ribosomal protein S6e